MLSIKYEKQLARMLGVSLTALTTTLGAADDYYEILHLLDPARPGKLREVINVIGPLRRLQTLMYRNVLLPRLPRSCHSHGGVRGRSVKSNAEIHVKSKFIFKADISNFYPTIRQPRVYRLFRDQFSCSPPVAGLCTRLCTFDHYLALGLVTSPILADRVLDPVDARIAGACEKTGLVYSRFVDDVTISGAFDIRKSGVPRLINEIFNEAGFRANPEKFEHGRIDDGIAITGIRVNRRRNLDVKIEYVEGIQRQLDDARRLAAGLPFDKERPYYTRAQIRGRIQFVLWVNRGRGRELVRRYRQIAWGRVEEEANAQCLIVCKKRLQKIVKPLEVGTST